MPPTKRNHPSTDAPIRRSSPRLQEKNRNKYSHSTATKTAATSSAVTQARSSSTNIVNHNKVPPFITKKPTNSPIISRQRGKVIGNIGLHSKDEGEDDTVENSTGRDVDRSLHVDFDKEDGSDTDSFVSTLGFLKDIEGKSGYENEKVSEADSVDEKGGDGVDVKGSNDDDAEDDDDDGSSEVMSPVLLLPEKKKRKSFEKKTTENESRSKIKRSNRSTNYTELEDLLITKAFVSVSEDPINGSQQRANIFWAKVQ